MPEGPSRRNIIKTGMMAGVGIGGGVLAHADPAAAVPNPAFADVVVVGAGYAGMAAAWELHKQRQRVIVLEANPRVGGRVWSSQLSDGTLFEIGGQWVGNPEVQPDIRQLMDELGVGDKVYKQYDEGDNSTDGRSTMFARSCPRRTSRTIRPAWWSFHRIQSSWGRCRSGPTGQGHPRSATSWTRPALMAL